MAFQKASFDVAWFVAAVTVGMMALSNSLACADAPAPNRQTARFEINFMKNMIDHHNMVNCFTHVRHFSLAVSNALQGFQRQRRLPQLQVLLSPSMPRLGHLAAALFMQRDRVAPVIIDRPQVAQR